MDFFEIIHLFLDLISNKKLIIFEKFLITIKDFITKKNMQQKPSIEEFISAAQSINSITINSSQFLLNLFITAVLASVLALVYVKYGNSLSNRKHFSRNFILISMTTMVVITIVKSSLALSLGLVGALSIVRFRAAIKEPEELAFIFLAITIGLGLGANQTLITIIALVFIVIFIILIKTFSKDIYEEQNLHLVISSENPNKINSRDIIKILKKSCNSIDLKRLDESNDNIELSFLIEIDGISKISNLKNELKLIDKKINITFLDNKGLL